MDQETPQILYPMISESTKNKVISKLTKHKKKADYVDVRIISSKGTLISFRKKDIEDVSLPRGLNGVARAITDGGWGYVNFNDLSELDGAIQKAVSYSKKVGRKKTKLSRTEKIKDKVVARKEEKVFTKVPLNEKISTIKKYNDLIWKLDKKLASSSIYYTDSLVKKLFISSQGTSIYQEKPYVYSIVSVVANKNGVIQQHSRHLADNSYKDLKDREKDIKKAVKIVNRLVNAPVVKSGSYTVVLEPRLAGVFAHEAFGHLSEADNVYENDQLAKVMVIGKKFGSKLVSIVDDPTLKGYRGSYIYDDEGVKAKRTVLLEKGILKSRLHMRETAGKLKEANNGHGRASGANKPQVRMGITYILPGTSTFKEMLKGVRKGIYCVGWQGGNTDHENFTFTAGYGIEIKNGKLGDIVRDVKLAGNLFESLNNVDMVGNDLSFEGGTCGKGGQYLPETSGAPHVRIKNTLVMGE